MFATSFRRGTSHAHLQSMIRQYGTASTNDVRTQLTTQLKAAMKAKDTFASTTIRSVLAEVYAADKLSPEQKITSSAIITVLRKATARRVESVRQFTEAAREDLAEKERKEIDFISQFLPALLSEAEVDRVLKEVLSENNVQAGSDLRKISGPIFKSFYAKVDRSLVDPELVKQRAATLLTN